MRSFLRLSFSRSRLYHAGRNVAMLATAAALVGLAVAQFGRRTPVDKGPRAVGLIQLQSSGKARLIPVAIMIDGKFYDASSYKADPVPMALDFDTVYEGFRTGVSQGLMTITQPGRLRHTWIAEGTWLPAGAKPKSAHLKAETPNIEEKDSPPRLKRPGEKTAPASVSDKTTGASSPEKSSQDSTAQQKTASSTPSSTSTDQKKSSAPSSSTSGSKAGAETSHAASVEQPIEDPNRPVLRRGKPDPNLKRERMKDFQDTENAQSAKPVAAKENAVARLVPAISDAGGPDARPYTYDTKPSEETAFREKMLDLAAQELNHAKSAASQTSAGSTTKPTTRKTSAGSAAARKSGAPSRPEFSDVQLNVFDLSSSNQPVLVLSATLPAPQTTASPAPQNLTAPLPQEVTLVARTNLDGELRKLFFSATDAQHLDVTPRMELIDAVDADGDGRGELLFRRTTDAGTSYAIYRATADQLWPLYEGTP